MKAVFIGGSRSISRLNPSLRAKLNSIIRKNYRILVGDANGADKAVQHHLQKMGYNNVVVFCMGETRNNLGNWPTRCIYTEDSREGFAYYSKKDMVMGDESDCGLMLWDGKSKGTLRNILHLLQEEKPVHLYLSPVREFYTLAAPNELRSFLAQHSPAWLRRLENDPVMSAAMGRKQAVFGF